MALPNWLGCWMKQKVKINIFTSYKTQFTHPPFFIASITLAKNYFTFFSKNNENRK
jgi:hypothetical protein